MLSPHYKQYRYTCRVDAILNNLMLALVLCVKEMFFQEEENVKDCWEEDDEEDDEHVSCLVY